MPQEQEIQNTTEQFLPASFRMEAYSKTLKCVAAIIGNITIANKENAKRAANFFVRYASIFLILFCKTFHRSMPSIR